MKLTVYGYYQDTSEYVKKIGGHHASFNATPPILGKFDIIFGPSAHYL